jgi:apolipoprotein N-acyltransferase
MILLRGIVVWLILIVAESINGAIRVFWLVPSLGNVRGHQIAFVIGSLLVLTIPIVFVPWLRASRLPQLISVGVLWLVLTVLFELMLGRLVFGYSWEQIAADYNIRQGGLMPFGLLLLTLSPLIAAKIRGVFPDRRRRAI